jgi:hypothetical protein
MRSRARWLQGGGTIPARTPATFSHSPCPLTRPNQRQPVTASKPSKTSMSGFARLPPSRTRETAPRLHSIRLVSLYPRLLKAVSSPLGFWNCLSRAPEARARPLCYVCWASASHAASICTAALAGATGYPRPSSRSSRSSSWPAAVLACGVCASSADASCLPARPIRSHLQSQT